MSKQREALELARAATPHDQLITELLDSRIPKTEREHAAAREIKKLREALAETEQYPVAWMYHGILHTGTPHDRPSLIWRPEYMDAMSASMGAKATPLYTAPPQRKPLTDEEVDKIIAEHVTITDQHLLAAVYMAIREVEQAHGIGSD
jgi:hypothetical protein